jgi:hypothetical protein
MRQLNLEFSTFQLERIGREIALELQLKPMKDEPDKYDLIGGTKTNIGLARTVLRIFEEEKANE